MIDNTEYSITSDVLWTQAKKSLPWFVIALFILLPFPWTDHSLQYVEIRRDDFNLTNEQNLINVEQGNTSRRLAFLSFAGVAAFLLAFYRRNLERYPLQISRPLVVGLCCMCAWIFLSFFWSDTPLLTIRRLVILSCLFVGAIAIVRLFSWHAIATWVFASTLSFLIIGLLIEIGSGNFLFGNQAYRLAGTLHPNLQGVNCGLLVLTCPVMARYNRKNRFWYALVLALGIGCLMLTKSRTAFVATLTALTCYYSLRGGPRLLLLTVPAMGFLVCLAILFREVLFDLALQVLSLGRSIGNSSRIPIWQDALSYLPERFWTGYGYKSFWNLDRIDSIASLQGWGVAEAHSTYVEILLELGVVGLAIFCITNGIGLCLAIRRAISTQEPIFAFFAAVLVMSLTHGILESGIMGYNYFGFLYLVSLFFLALRGHKEIAASVRPGQAANPGANP